MRGMALGEFLRLAARFQTLAAIGPRCLKKPVADRILVGVGDDEGFCDEIGQSPPDCR